MSNAIVQAQPPLEFIPPALNPSVLKVVQLMLPTWIRSSTAITQIEADNVEVLVELYRQFQAGKIRFLMAFRHPKVDDPLCLGYLFSHIVPRVARHRGVALQHPIHAHFIYDRGIPLWAGAHIGWVASKLGGTPILRGKADWTGLRTARDLFVNSKLPMAAAPEGATNGLQEVMSPLEPGIAQFGFWCAEDLQKAGRDEQVVIVPIGIKYSYINDPWNAIAQTLTQLEIASGLSIPPAKYHLLPIQDLLYTRLLHLAEHLLCLLEKFYTRFYHQTLAINTGITKDINEEITQRLQALLDIILHVSEQYFDLQPKGNLNDRCRRVEQAGWNYIYREEFKDIKGLSPMERALGDRIAEEAAKRMWHMRLVESFVAVTGKYIREKPTAERFAETTMIVWDMVTRILDGNTSQRPVLGKQRVKITIGKPMSVSEHYPTYKASRQGARQSVTDFTKNLQQAMQGLIEK